VIQHCDVILILTVRLSFRLGVHEKSSGDSSPHRKK
jgi:hypothetical protein